MNKVMLCIEMLTILSAKEIMNKNEIADILEINPRNVIEYVRTLREIGYDISSVKGVYGGYHLNKDSIIPTLKLSQKEVNILKTSCLYLEHKSDFLDYKTYIKSISKVLSGNIEAYNNDIKIIDKFPLTMSKDELLFRYNIFNEAMNTSNKCEIEYLSASNKIRNHIIHPYKVFIFSGSWFVLAWNETVNNFGYFKLNRINSINILPTKFTIMKTYNESDYLDDFGMKNNGEYYDIKIELTDLYTAIYERTYGKNQKITRIDDHKTILECSMQNKSIITSFVLGFGSKARVIEPAWLREEIYNNAKAILNN